MTRVLIRALYLLVGWSLAAAAVSALQGEGFMAAANVGVALICLLLARD